MILSEHMYKFGFFMAKQGILSSYKYFDDKITIVGFSERYSWIFPQIVKSVCLKGYNFAFNLDHHSMNVTYKGGFVYIPRFCVLMVQVFLSQVIGLSSIEIWLFILLWMLISK
jgi:hypothetical protein